VRQGKLTGNHAYRLDDFEFPDEEVVAALLTQFYQGERYVPDEIILPVELEDRVARAEYLSERKGRSVALIRPQRGDRVQLLQMAMDNASQGFRARQDEHQYEM
jgi:excinuclease ABC subunit C